jgi:hypothetical protein
MLVVGVLPSFAKCDWNWTMLSPILYVHLSLSLYCTLASHISLDTPIDETVLF